VEFVKIVFIPNLPYTYRDHKRLGVKYFFDKGYDVEVLDIHHILHPEYKQKVSINYWTFESHYEIQTNEALFEKIQNLNESDYIFFYLTDYKMHTDLLENMKSKTKAKFITYVGGSIPNSYVRCGLINNIKKIILPLFEKYVSGYKKGKFDTDIFVSGSKKDELIYTGLIGKNTVLLKVHSRDYNLCLGLKSFKNNKPHVVYVDTDAIDASDYILTGKKINVSIKTYKEKIKSYLAWIEKNYGVEVIIAAHPKSRIYHNKKEFEGFRVVHGDTASLIKSSEFIITEGSTSISYAVFYEKPLILFSMSEINFFEHTCSFAKELNKQIINIDFLSNETRVSMDKELLNKSNYNYYKYNYMTYNDNKIQSFEIIENYINEK